MFGKTLRIHGVMKIAGRGIRPKRNRGKIFSKTISVDGILFDSLTESRYYRHLKDRTDVKHIEIQPEYVLLEPFEVRCRKCKGIGTTPSPKTGKGLKCQVCKGTGQRPRLEWTYKADFKVTYIDGYEEVIDVKGYTNERFPLVRKMWESQHGQELVVVKVDGRGWKRS